MKEFIEISTTELQSVTGGFDWIRTGIIALSATGPAGLLAGSIIALGYYSNRC